MVLALSDIRSIATSHDYEEISLNETSRVISFRGGPKKSTRINVYYTTGTVGTCLNHPKRGKTQLFRRNITTLDLLTKIFAEPRVHTGDGYYTRQNIRQQWKKSGENNVFLRDSARRWLYVANATGLVKNEREMNTIVEICTEWDDLYWEKEDDPDLLKTNYACGSRGGLAKMICEVIRITYGEFHTCSYKQATQYLEGAIEKSEVKTERPFNHECGNLWEFLEEHADDVRKIQFKFLSLRKRIRVALAQWFLSRDVAGSIFLDENFQMLEPEQQHWELVAAHHEYGELMYPKKAGLCNHCGVLVSLRNEGKILLTHHKH
jgi:hypothetical protein